MSEVFEQKLAMFLLGSAKYKDVFSQAHVTRFCVQLTAFNAGANDVSVIPLFGFTDWFRFNCIDDQCERHEQECLEEMPPELAKAYRDAKAGKMPEDFVAPPN
jgi:hypothetical protein